MNAARTLMMGMLAVLMAGCGSPNENGTFYHPLLESAPVPAPLIRQPVLPEMLKGCRGHVLVPALGMGFVARGSEAPLEGQFLREENLSAPYRIIPPGARVTQDMNPIRLNIELDKYNRVVGLYCG